MEYSDELWIIPNQHIKFQGSTSNTFRDILLTRSAWFITKTCLYICDPLKPHFYIVKLGFTGVYIIFLIFAQNIDCGYSLEPPRWGGSNEYPQSMFWANVWKISVFYLKIFNFLEVKVSIYLNRRVFVMDDRKNEKQYPRIIIKYASLESLMNTTTTTTTTTNDNNNNNSKMMMIVSFGVASLYFWL